ncbi:MAG: choice-of-anchor tandem repeat GloVer-containing protein, partial [Candidatus Korobacteraceae bacterium]
MKTYSAWKVAIIAVLMCAAFAISSSAQTLTTIYDFCLQYPCPDGADPLGTLVQGSDGNFYGTTSDVQFVGQGTVYKLTSSGTLTTLHSFTGLSDGGVPLAGLIQASDGNFYGTTEGGGVCGVAYKITASGTLTPVHEFAGGASDGCQPDGPLVQAADGNFYGTTYLGGGSTVCQDGCGTVFKITTGGSETLLHVFCLQSGCPDGASPHAGLVQGSDGNLYGETPLGGANNAGSVFKITTSGTLTTLHSFNGTDGSEPVGGLVQGSDGNFYGTTVMGGANGGGAVFKMTPSGTLTTLYSFCSQQYCRDGSAPEAGLLQASDGNFYGTTLGGGAHGYGTIFAITSDGAYSLIYSFCSLGGTNCTDGAYPEAGLIQATDRKLYGVTTQGGGPNLGGTAFSLQVAFSYTLTVSTSGDGTVASTDGFISCPGTCSHTYSLGAQVTLNATPG